MLNKKRTAIIFTANTPHLAHANLMLNSLRDKKKGNFQGDIWVISTGLSQRAKNFCDINGIYYLVSNLSSLKSWKNWVSIAKSQPEYKNATGKSEGEKIRLGWEAYRNKRMSKLIILDWIEKFGGRYDFIALGDNDLYFQKDIHELFENEYKSDNNEIHYAQEEMEILEGSWLWNKDFHYSRFHDTSEYIWGSHEINIGFILAKPWAMFRLFEDVKKEFFNIDVSLFTQFNWHDQDLVRVVRAREPERFSLIQAGNIVHLCAEGDSMVYEKSPLDFFYKDRNQKPYIIHFAGGTWKKFSSVRSTYTVNQDVYYFINEISEKGDIIRQGSTVNIFDDTSIQYYTEQNKKSKFDARTEWINRSENKNHKFLFIGWLQTGTHKSTVDNLPGVFDNTEIDLAVLNGNVVNKQYPELICEEFPQIIAELSRIIKDQYLVRTFGYQIPNVPSWIFQDTIKAAIEEYNCPRKTALALANICYFYFSDALSFYSPEVVLLWGYLSPWGKLIGNLCKWKNIPIASLEWGILPGTVSFDFCGHMGDSWVTKYSDYFNGLKLDEEDIAAAEDYLEIANNPDLSRNVAQELDDNLKERVDVLRKRGKKIVLFMESNSAHSGNTFYDEKRAKFHSPFFKDDSEAYDYLNSICKKHSDWVILYKPHPISISRGLKIKINQENTLLILHGGLSEALELADISMTILSQSAYVSLIHGVPTVLLGTIQLTYSDAAYVPRKKDDIEFCCMDAFNNGISDAQKDAFILHVAHALKYYVFKTDNNLACRDSYDLTKELCAIVDDEAKDFYFYETEAYNNMQCGAFVSSCDTKISIIMPVHNAGEYLSACLDSICNQTFKDWELICINNGSTDDSAEILNYYSLRDNRIIIHEQEEPSQTIARNWGIKHSKGKYIYLIDSDDYLDLNALEILYDTAESKNADVVYFFFREVRTDNNAVRNRPRFFEYRKYFPQMEVFKLTDDLYKFFIQYPFPWAKLIKRNLIEDEQLFFDEDCSNFDDNPHNLRMLLNAKNPYVLNRQFYNFRIHTKSMTQSNNPRIMGMIDAVRIMNEIYQDMGRYNDFQKWYVPYKIHLIEWAWKLLPSEFKKEYYDSAKSLFFKSDEQYFVDDSVWSIYELPQENQIQFIKDLLFDTDFEKKYINNKPEEIQVDELQPWEKISKPHLYAIKICEKLHIINFAIKAKHFIMRLSGNKND